mmetsp:Transcript_24626/g.68948  ORF Transcript_24626/g.68948 Transcript_24626/m.68948 type:complete len:217 (-) Transcript_24626:289-939(-)
MGVRSPPQLSSPQRSTPRSSGNPPSPGAKTEYRTPVQTPQSRIRGCSPRQSSIQPVIHHSFPLRLCQSPPILWEHTTLLSPTSAGSPRIFPQREGTRPPLSCRAGQRAASSAPTVPPPAGCPFCKAPAPCRGSHAQPRISPVCAGTQSPGRERSAPPAYPPYAAGARFPLGRVDQSTCSPRRPPQLVWSPPKALRKVSPRARTEFARAEVASCRQK